MHIMKSHMKKEHHCDKCSTLFEGIVPLEEHTKAAHPGAVHGLPCDICGIVFRGRSGLREHKRAHHGHEDPLLLSGICSNMFRGKKALEDHDRIHIPDKLSPVICEDGWPEPP